MSNHDNNGRFTKGNQAAKGGNPHTAKMNQYRRLFFEVCKEEDMKDIIEALIITAKNGEQWAVKEALDRGLGKATQPIEGDVNSINEIVVRYADPTQPEDE